MTTTTTSQPRPLNRQEAAEMLGITPRVLENLARVGRGPAFYRVGKSIRYEVAALDRYKLANTRQNESATA